MNFTGLLLDVVATFVYAKDFFRVQSDFSYILTVLDVINYDEVQPQVMRHKLTAEYATSSATTFMIIAASKFFVPLLFLFIFGLLSIKSMWEVVSENKRIQDRLTRS